MQARPVVLDAHDVRLAAELDDSGDGQWLVFLHGGGFTLRSWDKVIGALGSRFRTCAIDLPGHGLSDPLCEDASYQHGGLQISAAMDDAGIAEPVIIGWSLGWPIALCAEAERTDVRGLVSVDGAVVSWDEELAPFFASKQAFLDDLRLRARDVTVPAEQLKEAIASDPLHGHTSDAEIARIWQPTPDGEYLRRPPFEDGIRRTIDNWDFDVAALWAQAKCPVLYVLATRHPQPVVDTHRDGGQRRRREHAGTRVVELDASHAVPLDAPDQLATRIAEFVS